MTVTTTDVILWSVIEPCISTITACLPLMAPLVKSAANSSSGSKLRSYLGWRDGRRKSGYTPDRSKSYGIGRSGESVHAKKAWQSIDKHGNESNVSSSGQNYELGGMDKDSKPANQGIYVQHTAEVEESYV